METTTITSSSPAGKTLQMPIGYRFCPTDEEIIIHYLRPKVFNFPLPATAIINSDDLFLHHPSRLPGSPKEKRYFFHKPSYGNNDSNPAGYWKPVTKNGNTHQLILATGCNHPIGFKKSFVFHQFSDHRRSGSKTPWVLHQFSLLYPLQMKIQEWTVCSIHMKLKNLKNQHQGPVKRLKRSYTKFDQIHDQDEVVDDDDDEDDSVSGITFIGDVDDRKDEQEQESRLN